MNKEEIKLHYKIGDIDSELRDGYVSNSNIHDLLYAVLELFESAIDKRLQAAEFKWLSWFWELVSEDGLTKVQTGTLPEILASAVYKQKFVSDVSPARDTNTVIDDVIIEDSTSR